MRPGILLVDDDREDQFIFCDAMASIAGGEQVHCEMNGIDALKYLSSLPAHSLPCVIVVDLNMPRMTGTEFLVRVKIQEVLRDIPVIVYSTSINPFEKEATLRLGAHSYITKPLTHSESLEVAQMIKDLCRKMQVQK